MKKSKLAIASFILSLLPIIFPVFLLTLSLVSSPGTPIQTLAPLEIVDGEVVGGGGVKDTGRVVSATDFSNFSTGRVIGVLGYLFSGTISFTFLFSVLAIILGVIALVKTKRHGLGGKWLAIISVIIGVITVITAIWSITSSASSVAS